ncbi:glucokinase [Actinacidiphila yanglinensis]|uniref:Glucokinase n=1 Tax=Actinacidiphila yanglinensis TaxID=310779 RepID=A0A1H6E499_9ACTN|nr:ROK family protein [Actinacidiphila yanglinensis]SEG91715.1 glucokinase [Actinacidiphila yanglinensis]
MTSTASTAFTASAASTAVPVLEVGGSHVTAAAVDPERATVIEGTRHRLPLRPDTGPEDFLAALAAAANGVLAAPALHTRALRDTWGVAVPGPFDYATGTARYRDVGKFAALDGLAVAEQLAPLLLRRPVRMRFLNDAHAFGLGAWLAGRPRERRFAAITLGTGVGSAFLDRGRAVVDGPDVPPEGRADLLTIDGRPLEDTVSTRALAARYTRRTGRPVDGLRGLSQRSARGDTAARTVMDDALRALGEALAPWLAAFEAGALVVGGSATAAWEQLGPPFTAGLTARRPELAAVDVTVRQDGEDAALLGAAEYALHG